MIFVLWCCMFLYQHVPHAFLMLCATRGYAQVCVGTPFTNFLSGYTLILIVSEYPGMALGTIRATFVADTPVRVRDCVNIFCTGVNIELTVT